MTISKILEKNKVQKIGGAPVVVLSLSDWEFLEDIAEEYLLSRSKRHIKLVKEARRDFQNGLLYEFNSSTGKFRKAC